MGDTNYKFHEVPPRLIDYVKDKSKSARAYFRYMLARTTKMFQYTGLPDTIPAEVLERYIQVNGIACITKGPDDRLYVFYGNLGNVYDVYYRPTKFIIANPYLGSAAGFTKECVVFGEEPHDGVCLRNDTEWIGLTPLIARYASLMAENVLTIRSADVMLRVLAMISAPSDKAYKSALDYLSKLEKGEFGVIGDSNFSEGIKMQSPPSNNGSYLTQFIELQQYLKGSFFGELGLRANYNMKREAIGKGESTLDEDAIIPLCDNMLMCRQQDMERVNEMFGTEIKVEYSSAWLQNHLEYAISLSSQLGAGEVGTTGDELGAVGADEKEVEKGEENAAENTDSGEGSGGAEGDNSDEHGDDRQVDRDGLDADGGDQEAEKSEVKVEEGDNPESRINDIHGNELMDIMKEEVDERVSSQLAEEKEGDKNVNVDEASTETEDTPTDD